MEINVVPGLKAQSKRTVELVGELHRELKIEAARRDIDMKDAVAQAIEAWLRTNGDPVAIRGQKDIAIPQKLVPVVEMLVQLFDQRHLTPQQELLKAAMLTAAEAYQRVKPRK